MPHFLLFFFTVLTTTFCLGQGDSDIIVTIDDHAITQEEFVRLYHKNTQLMLDGAEMKSPREYMELFINFKLKVLEAQRLGYDTLPTFVNELNTYRDELAKPYLTAVQYTDEMVKTAYERMQTEINVSHILLLVKNDASPQDTSRIYNQLLELRKQINNGAAFETLAEKYSEDPSVRQNKGNLGNFSAFQMVYPFEDAAYKTAVGEVSFPVRTKFGYHLIQVNQKRPARGQLKVAHIMKKLDEQASKEAIQLAKQQLDSLLKELQNGADFARLAELHSDDRQSANKGGILSWFSSSGMPPQFAEAAFALKHDDELSPVLRTPYGWHIIKRLEHRPVPSFDELEDFLKEKIRTNPEISQHNAERFIQNLKGEYQFKQDEPALAALTSALQKALDSNKLDQFRPAKPDQVLFRFANQQVTSDEFLTYLKPIAADQKTILIPQAYNNFVAETLRQYENAHLETKYPEFRNLVQEYHDGILLFNISEDKIWHAAATDSAGLVAFYKKNQSKYQWDTRFHGWRIKCPTQESRDFIEAVFEQEPEIRLTELQDLLKNHRNEEGVEVEFGYFEQGQDPLVDYFVWNAPKPNDFVDGLYFVRGNKVPPQAKTLQEAKGLYIADYQQQLEQDWLKQLRKQYKIKINKKLLNSLEKQ
ncbi:peptidylprolyl isomerase [Sunxiuqinia rutila]|uniref:peptidylprolyl isomerase n=1 Tax=Sunxiuqinia rutila TaxID=1397841 RepID=UPI003D35EE04